MSISLLGCYNYFFTALLHNNWMLLSVNRPGYWIVVSATQLARVTSVKNKVRIEIIVYNWSWSVYTVICHRFLTTRNYCKRLVVKLTIKCTTLNNFDNVCMKVMARCLLKHSFKNLLQIIVQVLHKRYMLFQILSPQLFVIPTLNMFSLTTNYINSCSDLYRGGSF